MHVLFYFILLLLLFFLHLFHNTLSFFIATASFISFSLKRTHTHATNKKKNALQNSLFS